MNYNAIYVNGKGTDIKAAICEMKEPPDIVIFGYPRSTEDYISYGALEEIKDGIFFSGKYESRMKIFNPPHVYVFANFRPNEDEMSKDRWIIKNISNNADTVPSRREGIQPQEELGFIGCSLAEPDLDDLIED